MEILVQSAALYSFCLILSLATYIASSNLVLITVGATNPIIVRFSFQCIMAITQWIS